MIYEMKKFILPILLGLALVASSCESLLDIPKKGSVSEIDFYKSDADAEALLTAMYANFVSFTAGNNYGIYNAQLMVLNYSADDVLAAGGNSEDHPDFRIFCEFRYDNGSSVLKNFYENYVNAIYRANLVISNLSNENRRNEEPKYESAYTKRCVEEARVMRAYLHMMMALSWNCPNIVDRLLDGDELPYQAQSQSEVLEWVIAQCEKAITSGSLPERASVNDKDATAIMTKGFAQFVAGKAAVFNNDMATARKYLGDLINSGKYDLVPPEDYWTNFHIAGDGNAEKIFEPNFIEDANYTNNGFGTGATILRGRWMVADVLCWRTGALASTPSVVANLPPVGGGWNGGAIQEDFAKKFLAHDGDSPRRKATFITEEEFLYEMDWQGSSVNNGSLDQKKADDQRGITLEGMYSHGPYFEWKNMVFHNPPKILTGGKAYPADNVSGLGANSNQSNFNVARYAEALLLYAEACIDSPDAAKGLEALQKVQKRSGSGKISTSLTFDDVMEEKQYELWFENCRFHDLVRWSKTHPDKVNLDEIFNTRYGGIHENVPTVYDAYFMGVQKKDADGKPMVDANDKPVIDPTYPEYYGKEHKLVERYSKANYQKFQVGKHEYFPFPRSVKNANPYLVDVLGWKTAADDERLAAKEAANAGQE